MERLTETKWKENRLSEGKKGMNPDESGGGWLACDGVSFTFDFNIMDVRTCCTALKLIMVPI